MMGQGGTESTILKPMLERRTGVGGERRTNDNTRQLSDHSRQIGRRHHVGTNQHKKSIEKHARYSLYLNSNRLARSSSGS